MIEKIKLPLVFTALFAVWLITQIGLVVYHWDLPCHDDALYYRQLAEGCIGAGTWYPAAHNLYDVYVFGPGYVNLLIGVYKLFGTFAAVGLVNLVLNVGLLLEIRLLGKRLFGETTGYVAAILYMLLFSSLYLPVAHQTDLPFAFLLAGALLLGMHRRMPMLVAAGVLIGLANWMRPLAVVFLATIVVCYATQRRPWRDYAAVVLPLLATVLLIGGAAKARTGHFVYQSTTGGVNLAMSAFDGANGLVNFDLMKDTANYPWMNDPTPLTFAERDRRLKQSAVGWIVRHPAEYASQIPLKLLALFAEDTWPERAIPGKGFGTLLPQMKGDKAALIALGAEVLAKSLTYYVVLFFFGYYVWINRRRLLAAEQVFLLIPLLGTAMTVAVVVTSRYHYPYLFMIIIYAASGILHFLKKRSNENV